MNINWKPTYIPGDLVYNHKGEVIRITSSYLKGTRLFYYKTDEISESTGCILEEALKPIPLTPEILEKNGWTCYRSEGECFGHRWYKHQEYPFTLRCNNFLKIYGVSFNDGKDDTVMIKCVDELQHILYGLQLDSNLKI